MKKTLIALATLAALSTASFAASAQTDIDKKVRNDEMIVMTQQMVDEAQAMVDKLSAMLTTYERQVKRMIAREHGDD
jgi:hypothetical protein